MATMNTLESNQRAARGAGERPGQSAGVPRSHFPAFPLSRFLPALLAVIPTLWTAPAPRAAEFFLRAAAVTNTMPDGTNVVQWGFARDSAFGARDGAVTVPGPILLVLPGDNVLTIRLDNDLPEPISIVINGQFTTSAAPAPVRHPDGRVRSFTHETPPGNTTPVTYTWSPVRPGTYLYLSGSHPQVQVPMGLYGALKKDTNNGVAYPGASYATDVLLLFSEIDPALNAAVATGNFGAGKARPSALGYEAKYFLINGIPYTNGAPPIRGGDPGKTNLIRLLNASLETHVPVLNGAYLSLIAQDGNLRPYPKNSYAVPLPPQKTIDALLVAPAAGTYALYDRRLGLVSGNHVPGGMLTHLSYYVLSLADAVDATALTWTTGGNAPWIPQSQVTHDNIDAAQSGSITGNQESWLETTVTGPGTLTFRWKVSSESGKDLLRLYVNGTERLAISGEQDWSLQTLALTSGTQTLRWRYNKNGGTSTGQDRAWLDTVRFAIPPIPLAIQKTGNKVRLTWTNAAFALQSAPFLTSTFTNVPGATSPYTNLISGSQRYFRLKAN